MDTKILTDMQGIIGELETLLAVDGAAGDAQTREVWQGINALECAMEAEGVRRSILQNAKEAANRMGWANARVNVPDKQRVDILKAYGCMCAVKGAVMEMELAAH